MAKSLAEPREEDWGSFALATRAFELMTPRERLQALEEMARLRYPSIADRFFEGVHRVITKKAVGDGAS